MNQRGVSGQLRASRNGSTRLQNVEGLAEGRAQEFLVRLQEEVEDDAWSEMLSAFTREFMQCQSDIITYKTAKHRAANLLADGAPGMLQDFLDMFDLCSDTRTWSGREKEILPDVLGGGKMQRADSSARGETDNQSTASRPTKRDWHAISQKLVPEGRGGFVIWFLIINTALILGIFAFMAMDYSVWVRYNEDAFLNLDNTSPADYQEALTDTQGSSSLRKWVTTWNQSWREFSFVYLLQWGGRYQPAIRAGQWWRWFTSIYIHTSLQHIVANMLLFLSLASHLELNYGWWRLLLVWIIAGVGGNLVSAAFEKACTLVVGASGAIFGFMGFFIADVVLNFESISRPALRFVVIVFFSIFFVVTIFTSGQKNVSHFSHIGGLVCGLFPSFVFLPNVRDKRRKAVQNVIMDHNRARPHTAEGAASMRRREERIQRHQEQAAEQLKPSWWSRHFPFNPLYLLSFAVMVLVFIVLPIWIYARPKPICPEYEGLTNSTTSSPSPSPGRLLLVDVKYG